MAITEEYTKRRFTPGCFAQTPCLPLKRRYTPGCFVQGPCLPQKRRYTPGFFSEFPCHAYKRRYSLGDLSIEFLEDLGRKRAYGFINEPIDLHQHNPNGQKRNFYLSDDDDFVSWTFVEPSENGLIGARARSHRVSRISRQLRNQPGV